MAVDPSPSTDEVAAADGRDPFERATGWALSHGVVMLAFAGVLAYTLGRLCYIAFYGAFGISPDEVGIDQARSVEAAGLLLAGVSFVTICLLGGEAAWDRGGWLRRAAALALQAPASLALLIAASLGDTFPVTCAALFIVILGVVIFAFGIRVALGSRSAGWLRNLNAPQLWALGLGLIATGSVTSAWQWGERAAGDGHFQAAPFSALRVDAVCVTPLTPAAPVRRDHAYARLGSADGVLVLYELRTETVLRVPETTVALTSSHFRREHPRCP